MGMGELDKALNILEKAFKLDENNALTAYNLGILNQTKENYKEAFLDKSNPTYSFENWADVEEKYAELKEMPAGDEKNTLESNLKSYETYATKIGSEKAVEYWKENKSDSSWLWVQNIWVADSTSKARADGAGEVIVEMLAVLDNLERAYEQVIDESDKKGVELILRQMKDALTNLGVTEIKADGEEFNPDYHNAVMQEEVDGVEEGKVIAVFQKGYEYRGKVLRYSMVKVSK